MHYPSAKVISIVKYYFLGSPTAIAPEWIQSYIVIFDNVDGPDLLMSPEWDSDYHDGVKEGRFEPIEIEMDLGDNNLVYVQKERQPNGKYRVWYFIEFWYRNVWARVLGFGWESDVNHEYLESAGRAVLSKLEEAPLEHP